MLEKLSIMLLSSAPMPIIPKMMSYNNQLNKDKAIRGLNISLMG